MGRSMTKYIAVGWMALVSGFLHASLVQAASCVSCHKNLLEYRFQHGPVAAEAVRPGGCIMCHAPAGRECTALKGGLFAQPTRDLCNKCHAKNTGSQHSGEQTDCLKCHDPHGSNESAQFLRKNK